MRLQQWFRSSGGFTYSTDAPRSDNRQDDAAVGLDRRVPAHAPGLLRALRLGDGRDGPDPGHPGPGRRRLPAGAVPSPAAPTQISCRDAHAWPELYFEGIGWVRFEPTPAGAGPARAPAWTLTPPTSPSCLRPRRRPGRGLAARHQARGARADDAAASDAGRRRPAPGAGRVPWRGAWPPRRWCSRSPPRRCWPPRSRRRRRAGAGPATRHGARPRPPGTSCGSGCPISASAGRVSWTPRALQARVVHEHVLGGTERRR